MSQIHKCEVCGSKVRIVGTGTMRYEPVITLEEILGGLPENKEFGKEFDEKSNCDSNFVNGYNQALKDCEQAIRGMFK